MSRHRLIRLLCPATLILLLLVAGAGLARAADPVLTGTAYGTPSNPGYEPAMAIDGDTATFYEAPTPDGNWVGIDFGAGAAKVITQITFSPRVDVWGAGAYRLLDGIFQGSDTPDFSDHVVELYRVQDVPNGQTTVTVSNANGFRYVRYMSPLGSYGDIGEAEFHGHDSAGGTVATPTLSPAGGSATGAQVVALACATSDAAIHYTVDGSVPTVSSPTYALPIALRGSATLSARAFVGGMSPSAVASATFTITSGTTGTVYVGTATRTGAYDSVRPIVVTHALMAGKGGGAQEAPIFLTTPMPSGFALTVPPLTSSPAASLAPIDMSQVGIPGLHTTSEVNAAGGDVTATVTVGFPTGQSGRVHLVWGSMVHDTPGGATLSVTDQASGQVFDQTSISEFAFTIGYNAPSQHNESVFDVSGSRSLLVKVHDHNDWNVAGYAYLSAIWVEGDQQVAPPVLSPAPGTYRDQVAVQITSPTTGAVIRYTLDGSNPTAASPLYTVPLVIDATAQLKARAFVAGWTQSDEAAGSYAITESQPGSGVTAYVGSTVSNGIPASPGPIVVTSAVIAGKWAAGDNDASLWYATSGPAGFAIDFPAVNGGSHYGPADVDMTALGITNNNPSGQTNTSGGDIVATVSLAPAAGDTERVHVVWGSKTNNSLGGATLTVVDQTNGRTLDARNFPDLAFTLPYNAQAHHLHSVFELSTCRQFRIAVRDLNAWGDSGRAYLEAVWVEHSGGTVATPGFTPAGGTYASAQAVIITSTTAGAAVHYTLDGSTPTVASPLATGPITIDHTATLTAQACLAGWTASATASAAYVIGGGSLPVAAAPTISPGSGTYATIQGVILASTTAGATIRYTLDGSDPATSGTAATASGPVTVAQPAILRAIASASGYQASPGASATYAFQAATPTAAPGGGIYGGTQAVTLTSTSSGAAIHYTLDGSDPTAASPLASGPLTVDHSLILTARAFVSGWTTSSASSDAYVIPSVPLLVSFTQDSSAADESVAQPGTVLVAVSPAPTSDVTVAYTVTGGTAQGSGSGADYTLAPGTLTFHAGQTQLAIPLTVIDDAIPEPDETVVIALSSSTGAALGAITTHTYTIRNDDLPAPVVQFSQGTVAAADAAGPVPDGFNITGVVVAAAGFPTPQGVLGDSGFTAHIVNVAPPATQVAMTLAFTDTYGHTGPSTALTVPFGNGTGSPVTTGDPTGLSAGTPTVTISVTAGLTGDQTGQLNGEAVNFTNQTGSTVILAVTATAAPGTITALQVIGDDGSVYDATSGTVALPTLAEGRYSFTAQATVTNGTSTATGTSTTPVVLIVDTTPPALAYTVPKRYWGPEYDQAADPPPTVPLRQSLTMDRDLVLLNGNADSDNQPLRNQRRMNVFDKAGYTSEADVVDVSGLSTTATQTARATTAKDGVVTTLTATVRAPLNAPRGDPQTVLISGFAGLTDSQVYNASDVLITDHGNAVLHVRLTDRAGNVLDADAYRLRVKTAKPAIVASTPSTLIAPYWFAPTVHDVSDVWQDSVGDGQQLTPLSISFQGYWLLKTPMAPAVNANASASVIYQDYFGNRSSAQTATVHRTAFMIANPENSYEAGHNKFPLIENSIFRAVFDPFPNNFIIPGYIGGLTRDGAATPHDVKVAFQFPDGTFPEVSLQSTEGLRELWRNTPTVVDSTFQQVSSIGIQDALTGQAAFDVQEVPPVDVGADGDQRRAAPAILTIAPSWQPDPAAVHVRVRDHGIAELLAGTPGASTQLTVQGVFDPDKNAVSAPEGTDAIAANFKIRRSPASGNAAAYLPGLSGVSYRAQGSFTSHQDFAPFPLGSYHNDAARWINLIQLTPDVVATGSRVTVRIEAGFLDDSFHVSDFSATGDYVHFLANGTDITQTAAIYSPSADPSTRAGKIAIAGQRLVVEGVGAANVQALELDLEIASNVAAGIYDVDVKCGGVKAYSDALSQAYKSSNWAGAHRMSAALCIFTSWAEMLTRDQDGTIRRADAPPEAGIPSPEVDLDPPKVSLEYSGQVHIALTGIVKDGYSETVGIEAKTLKALTVAINGVKVQEVPVTYGDGQNPWTLRTIRQNWSADIYLPALIPGGVTLSVNAHNATIGTDGFEDWGIPMDYQPDSNLGMIGGAGVVLALQPVANDGTHISIFRAVGTPPAYTLLGILAQGEDGSFSGPLTGIDNDGSITASLALQAPVDWAAPQLTATLRINLGATGGTVVEGTSWRKSGDYFMGPGSVNSQVVVRNDLPLVPTFGDPVCLAKSPYEESASFVIQYHYNHPLAAIPPNLLLEGKPQTLQTSVPIIPSE